MNSLEPVGSGAAEALVGRAREVALIQDFLAESAEHGGTVLLSGEPGVGKTVLLDTAAESATASGVRVLRAAGVEFEADISFSGLHQALLPLVDTFDRLGPADGDALRVALGFGSGPAPDRLAVSHAALALLRQVAAVDPLLLVVDDLPWIDRASAAVLEFVARRLTGTRVGFLGASRTGADSYFDRSDLPGHELQPLDEESAHHLLSTRFPGLAGPVRQRLLATARGNPLALLELPLALSGPQRAALERLPVVLPLNERLQTLFVTRVSVLPQSCRRLLLLAALDGTGSLDVLRAAARRAGEQGGLGDLTPAEKDQLVRVDEGARRLSFRHPLIRAAVVDASTSAERRAAHSLLAHVLDDQPERRAWHLGEASVEPDEAVAVLLEQAGHLILERGDAVGAIAALTRAAELSPWGNDRGRRLAEAAFIGADSTGELRRASELLAGARRADPELNNSLHAAAAAAHLIINGDGDIDTAHRLLVGAIESGAHHYEASDKALIDALHTLMLLCWFGGRRELWPPFYAALARLRPTAPRLLSVAGRIFPDPARARPAVLAELEELIAGLGEETDPTVIERIGSASVYLDRLSGLREASWRVVHQGREGGPVGRHLGAVMHLCFDDYQAGRWQEAEQLADEGIRLCESSGYGFFIWYFQYQQALLAAVRGEGSVSSALTDRMCRWGTPRGALGTVVFANHARTLAALSGGDFESAYRHACAVSPAGELASHVPHALWVTMDLVEAAVRTGRQSAAQAHVRAMQEADIAALSPRLALLAGGSAALCAGDEAVDLFERALATPGADRWPFDLARVQLAYGERLRRSRATADSRGPLGAALETFERLGARPWAERAGKELRVTGRSVPSSSDPATGTLTPQEEEIALLAASGMTNKQIAARLLLSHRTVGSHLYQVFPKLGITKRAALRDALRSLGKGTRPPLLPGA